MKPEKKKDEKRDFSSNKTSPKPPKTLKIKEEKEVKEQKKNETKEGSKTKNEKPSGPQKKRYNPEEGSERRFKGGEKSANATICKKRYQQISITALGDVNTTTNGTRILQTAPLYTMQLQVGTSDFSSANALTHMSALALALFALFTLSF